MLKVIGAGYGRTGTESTKRALERLLGARCYHMKELMADSEHLTKWERLFAAADRAGPAPADRDAAWRSIFDGYVATVDWPAARYYAELARVFPDAKVLLNVRDADAWFESMQVLVRVMKVVRRLGFVSRLSRMTTLLDEVMWSDLPDPEDRAAMRARFERHVAEVKAAVPPERLLVYRVDEGWEPLAELVGAPVPPEPFPHANRRGAVGRFLAGHLAREVTGDLRDRARRRGP